MASATFNGVAIKGAAITLGENAHNFDDEPQYWNNDQNLLQRLKKTIGFDRRYTASSNATACDLCFDAAARLIDKMNLSGDAFDAIISVTQTPDYYLPQNAHILHDRLKAPKTAIAIDICNGCTGYIQGLYLAFSLINGGGINRVLLCVGDTLSKATNSKDRSEYPLFCDCGSACVIEKSANADTTNFSMRADGSGREYLIKRAGAYRQPSNEQTRVEKTDADGNTRSEEDLYMNGFEVFKFTMSEQPPLLNEMIALAGGVDLVDLFLLHQANQHIVSTIARSAKIPIDKTPIIFPKYGNQNGSSIVGVICDQADRFDNQKVRVIMQGFGVGLSWGACLTTLDRICALKPHIYGG
jgi:3-oxoacyl-[acyl-carrier-protein] synthase-3